MTRRRNNVQHDGGTPSDPPPRSGVDPLSLATLIGVVAVLMISFSNWRGMDSLERRLDDRLDDLEDKIADVSARPASAPAPPRRGPDPSRVYNIKTDGAPSRGPASAAVTITEFSDFQ